MGSLWFDQDTSYCGGSWGPDLWSTNIARPSGELVSPGESVWGGGRKYSSFLSQCARGGILAGVAIQVLTYIQIYIRWMLPSGGGGLGLDQSIGGTP